MIVLDASALLALLFREPGAERVAASLAQAAISAVNLAEVLGRLVRDGRPLAEAVHRLAALGLEVVPLDAERAAAVAGLEPLTRPAGLSLGDRCCLALALERGVPALTADGAWQRLPHPVRVELIR